MESKSILVGIVIGVIVGALMGFAVTPKTDISGYESTIDQLGTQVSTLQSKLSALQEDYSKVQEDLENAVSAEDYSALEQQVTQLQSQVSTLQTQSEAKDTTITDLQATIEELQSMVPPPPPTEGEPGSSRFFPAEIGATLTCTFEYLFDTYTTRISVEEVVRGNSAWSMIHETNMFNDPPPEGFEYVLVKISFEYVSGPTADTSYDLSSFDFDAVSSDGFVYDSTFVVAPEPTLAASLYPGASHEGWAAYQVYKTDIRPVLAFGRDYSGAGGVWFMLYTEQ